MERAFTTRPEIVGTFGAVGSTHWLATASAMAVLERGGNAFDAAVAAGFVLQVVEPHLNGPGGDLPILLYDAQRSQGGARGGMEAVEVICGQGVAPAGASIAHYRGLGLELVPGSGLLATVVPGSFDAWMLLLRDHGTLRPADVLGYAIHYAEHGYPLVPAICEKIESVQALFADHWTDSAALYLPGGALPRPGSLFRNPRLAATYKRLLAEAEAAGGDREAQVEAMRDAWYRGFVAEAIDRYCRRTAAMDSSGEPHRGVLCADDMARWRAGKERPLTYETAGVTFCKGGAWSQGPVFLQQLALLEGFDLAAMDPLGPDFVHTVVECAKLAFADREAYYGDPDFAEVPLETLLSRDYADRRRGLVGPEASLALRPGEIAGYEVDLGHALAERDSGAAPPGLGGGEPTMQRGETHPEPRAPERPSEPAAAGIGGDTCHLDVADRWGNMVSATPSGGWLQSSPVIPELGFCLNSRAQMFWLEEGLPASLAPGKRPRTTLSVNLALKDGAPWMAFGTPGGDYQDQWSLTFALRHLHHGRDLQETIDLPMFQTDHMPSSFWPREADLGSLVLEDRFPEETVAELEARGHRVERDAPWSLGRLSAVKREDGLIKAGANPRRMQGYAAGR